jgi:phenylpropionate dioxygenase-like ring-hydroxylating dioxygenase large terminal subunit
MSKLETKDRVPSISAEEFYNRAAEQDSRPVPDALRESRPYEGGSYTVPVERFLSKEFHDREVEKLWKRVWQFTCREEEIPNVGDVYFYEVALLKFIVVRTAPNRIKAYVNSCLHRGRQLVDHDCRVSQLRCPFHGFTWDLEGRIASIPCAWEFSRIEDPEYWKLPEAKVETWCGFVFINPDPQAGSLKDFLGQDIDPHFERYGMEDRYILGHARKVIPCNWKIAQEGFLESYHIIATHPQLMLTGAQTDTKYDVFGNYSRGLGVYYIPNAYSVYEPTEQEIVDSALDLRLDQDRSVELPEGLTARQQMAAIGRAGYERVTGESADRFADTEMVDVCFSSFFPNFHPWPLFARICYVFRPYRDDPNKSWMDIYQLGLHNKTKERPPAAKVHVLKDDEDWTAAPEINPYLGRVANQDMFNLGAVQEGMKTSATKVVNYAKYQESRIRSFHDTLDKWLAT